MSWLLTVIGRARVATGAVVVVVGIVVTDAVLDAGEVVVAPVMVVDDAPCLAVELHAADESVARAMTATVIFGFTP